MRWIIKSKDDWHLWFAWHPVCVWRPLNGNSTWVWFEWVHRKRYIGSRSTSWIYREMEK